MSRIHPTALKNIFTDIESTDKVSLFIYSTKSSGLVKVDLDHLSEDQRSAKLQKWSRDNRFVAVIEKIDNSVVAFINAKYAEQLQSQNDLSIDGIKGKKLLLKL